MGRHTVDIRCRCCKKPGKHMGRGLIISCYTRHQRAGTLHRFPIPKPASPGWSPTGRLGEKTLDRYIALDTRGLSPARIRFELGLSARQVQRYAKAAKERQLAAAESITERQSA
ncbi:hypothetical protein [Streptosporangium sp. NPDC049078]|uniref:hypothetical protein n=1 Tax=Streptosporangium sp. NPDC049078 TaxID=3155767 RepID=UPI003440015E